MIAATAGEMEPFAFSSSSSTYALDMLSPRNGEKMSGINSKPLISTPTQHDVMLHDGGAEELENTGVETDDEFLEDDWADWDAGDQAEPLTKDSTEAYRFADSKAEKIFQGKLATDEPERNPAEFLGFVAKNTNPGWASFAWENFVDALKNCYEQKSLKPLFNLGLTLNCVYCARAVDLTLHQVLSKSENGSSNPKLIQVAQGRPGSFTSIFQNITAFSSRDGDARYLEKLKTVVAPGQRACITVPVTGVQGRFSHAMNLVNMGPAETGAPDRVFIVCGQSGRVFDLQSDSDAAAFYARHTNDSPDDFESDVKYAITSGESEQAHSTLQELALATAVKNDRPSAISAFV